MFCTKCGKQIGEVEELCASCGAKILRPNDEKKENIVLAVFAVILSIIIPAFGFLLGMIGASVYKTPKYKDLSARAMTISVSLFLISCFALILYVSLIL